MAEREGFEPSIPFKQYTPLAGERLRPLGHLSVTDQAVLVSGGHNNNFINLIKHLFQFF